MKYLKCRSLAVAAQPDVPLRSDFHDSPAFLRIYHFHVALPLCSGFVDNASSEVINGWAADKGRSGQSICHRRLRREFPASLRDIPPAISYGQARLDQKLQYPTTSSRFALA